MFAKNLNDMYQPSNLQDHSIYISWLLIMNIVHNFHRSSANTVEESYGMTCLGGMAVH